MTSLRVAQIIASTEAEGPGARFALWVQGCSLRCPGCCNPEMFAERGGTLRSVESLIEELEAVPNLEGVSILGGEPFEQAAPLAEFAQAVRRRGLTVMVYSGCTLAELKARGADAQALLATTDLLVDGRYEQQAPEHRRRWVGSTNQQMHFLSSAYRPDDPRFTQPNTMEIRLRDGEVTVNGWPVTSNGVTFRRAR